MDFLNQPKGIRGHYQQIAKAPWTGIPVCVRCTAWRQHGSAGVSFDLTIADLDAYSAFEDIPDFVIAMVEM
jgi:hypothetical protein